VLNPNAIRILMELVQVPVIVDAGVGTASDVALAMELGIEGVLLNSGIALAREPLRMAAAMRDACTAGRQAFLAGRIEKRLYANASSPEGGLIAPAPRRVSEREPAPAGE
jgi:thiazole synthase